MDLKDKNVLVTGGGSGMGWAIARGLAAEGCRVVICGRTEKTLRAAAASADFDPPIRWRTCDVADREDVARLFAWMSTEIGTLDILVNSAGTNVANRMMSNIDPADFDLVMAVNTTGPFNCARAALPGMREKKAGLIVNISSLAGKRNMLLAGLPYCVSKAAAGALGSYLNLEDNEHGIRVTTIYPGETNTPIVDRRPEPPPPERRAQMLQPEDVAACVLLVAKLPPRAVVSELVITNPYLPLT